MHSSEQKPQCLAISDEPLPSFQGDCRGSSLVTINGQDASSSKAPDLQYGKGVSQPRMVNEIGGVDNLRLENQLTELTSLVRQLVVVKHQPSIAARVCGICTSVEHPTDMCPTLQKTKLNHPKSVGAIAISVGAKSRAIYSSTIWTCPKCTSRSSRLSIAESAISSTTFPTTVVTKSASSMQLAISRESDEAASNKQSGVPTKYELQQNAIPGKYEGYTIQDFKTQIGQLANIVSHLQSIGSGNLHAQTIPNLRVNASVVTLKSGRELLQPAL
ncbi:hypothetical protein CR513_08036, partial [Mucuna pruriens]